MHDHDQVTFYGSLTTWDWVALAGVMGAVAIACGIVTHHTVRYTAERLSKHRASQTKTVSTDIELAPFI